MSSRVRSRFVAITAALPLLVVGGPLVTPANAVDGVRQADIATTQGALRIGPRAGFRGDVARGINGNTAIAAIDASSSTTLEKVSVSVTQGGPFSLYDDFDSTDGFALYKDLDDDDHLDVADYDAGPVSLPRYDIGFSGGAVVVTVNADQSKATGEDSYLLTVHPSANISDERIVKFAVPANGVDTTGGTFPAATVTLDDILLDSRAPDAIPLTNFEAVSRPPLDTCPANAAEGACGDDSYKVYRSSAAETGEQLGFFNAPGDLSDAALLVKPNGSSTLPALYDVSGISGSAENPTTLSIGNGTGRDASTPGSRALNNQVSDDILAVQWDLMGNTVTTELYNTPKCDQNVAAPCPHVNRGNDVTAPSLTYSVTMDQVNAASTPNAIAVRGTVANGADAGVHAWVKRTAVEQLAKPEHVRPVAGSNPVDYTVVDGHVGTEKRSAANPPFIPGNGSGTTLITNVDVSNNTLFPQNELVRSQARLVDAYGNAMAPKATAPVLKDTIAPSFTRISLIDGNGNGLPDMGEVYRVEFNDPMDTADITSGTVNARLTVKDPAVTACGPPTAPTTKCVDWGQSPTVSWSDDARILSITLGAPCDTLSQTCSKLTELPETGHLVSANGVTDKNQNSLLNPTNFAISAPSVLAFQARTVDSLNVGTPVYNTGRDGVLDAIDVEFTAPLNTSTIADASNEGLFEVTWAGTTVVADAVAGAANDTVHLTFTLPSAARADWSTGALPVVELKSDGNGSTRLKTATNSSINAFSLTAVDRAAPVPVAMTTKEAVVDGKIDQVHVKFSEAIVHAKTNPCGYSVTGYGDANYKPAGFSTTPSAASCPAGMPGTIHRNEPSPVPAGATASDTVSLKLAPGSVPDTHATPTVTYAATNGTPSYAVTATPEGCMDMQPLGNTIPNCPVEDAAENGLGSFSGTAADGAGPAIIERTTADTNSDGRLDEIRVKFSETLSTPSIANALFAVSDPSYTILSLAVLSDKDLAIRLENIAPRRGDTGVKPKLTFFGGTTDLADPPASSPADTGVVVTDKAGPALLGACASSPTGTNGICPVDDAANDKVTVLLSEPIEPGSVAQTDFVVEQPAGTAKTQTAAPAFEDSNKRVVLTFAQGSIDSAAEGVVRLAAASAITDAAAAGANPSTQVTNVPIHPAPSVTIDLTCPTPANPGYCSADKVNTGAAGTAAVSRWRLSETARTATPPDTEYTEGIPTVYPASGVITEGVHTLYLSGKDDFGRLTPEVSDTITVYKAPKILNVQFVNSAIRGTGTFAKTSTVMDGDTLHIGADAYGTDAAQWAANNAPTGGGCLVSHMSINLKPLTGTNNHTAVPPTKCDLRTTTEQPFRQMQFPVVKAAGTTRYPVGTVLKVTDSDPGSMIVDGPGGTLRRRQFISVNARRSWNITDASVIKVPTTLVNAIPRLTNLGYRNGAVLRATSGYYYVHNGTKRPVSTTQLAAWRISTARAYAPTSSELKAMPTGTRITGAAHAAGTWIKYTDGRIYQLVTNAQGATVRRQLAHGAALRTLVPSTQVYPANSSDSKVAIDTWLRGYRDGTVLKLASGGYGVIARGMLRKFANSTTFNTLGYSTSNAIAANGAAIPRVKGQAYDPSATPIDRYKITTVVIKVTNKAGAFDTEVVIPSLGGIYGVGTLHPIPNGWDVTR